MSKAKEGVSNTLDTPTTEVPSKQTETAQNETLPVQPNRRYGNVKEIDSDLFKLELGYFDKNIGVKNTAKDAVMTKVEHAHFYHTIDSNGKRCDKCNAVGGHTHAVEVTVDGEGNLIANSGPAIGGYPGHRGNTPKTTVPGDSHTHKTTYIKSDRFEVRRRSEAAAQFVQSQMSMPKND